MSEILMKFVRPVITLIAVLGLTIGFFTDKVTADAYVPLMAMTIVYWFKSLDREKENHNGDR